jgi:tetratricopeptide (TPR) repeat protein
MIRAFIALSLILSGAEVGLTQIVPVPVHKPDGPCDFLTEVRAMAESLDKFGVQAGTEMMADKSPFEGEPGASLLPSLNAGSTAQIVSADSLRHRVPKAAKQSYQRALRLSRGTNATGAVKELEKAISLDPAFAMAHNNLGVQYAWVGQYQGAEAEFRRTIELMPESSVAHANLALVLHQLGNREEAELNLKRAVQLAPDDRKARLLLNRLLSENPDTRVKRQRDWALK